MQQTGRSLDFAISGEGAFFTWTPDEIRGVLGKGAMGLVYDRWGRAIRAGNNLVIETIHEASPKVPLRMAPMVLLGTLFTHLFGGSAGREGTAVQMGASLADSIAHRLRLGLLEREGVLAAGIAGGLMLAGYVTYGYRTVVPAFDTLSRLTWWSWAAGHSPLAGATNWPPFAALANEGAGGDWSIVTRDDGSRQWAWLGKPLYFYAKDQTPGEITGDGFNNAWRVVKPEPRPLTGSMHL